MAWPILPSRLMRQPQQAVRLDANNAIARKATAAFPLNGNFRSAINQTVAPAVVLGPTFVAGRTGLYASGNGNGSINTGILPGKLGMVGAAPRTIIAEFYMGDTPDPKCLFSFGDQSTGTRTQFSVLINNQYRGVAINLYGNDLSFFLHGVGGTGFRVFLAITYDGNLTISVKAWSKLDTTGQVIPFSTSFTVGAPLATGTTFPLTLMGGGTYGFASMITPLYHLAFFGGTVLSANEIQSLLDNSWQLYPTTQRRLIATTASAPAGNAYSLPAAQGTYAITGNAVGLRAARRLAASAGAYTMDGYAVALRAARRLGATPGAYSITGQPANLVRGAAPRVLPAASGNYTVTGQPAALRVARRMAMAPGTYGITGFAAGAPASGSIPRYADATIMRLSVVQGVTNLGPDRLQQTTGFP